MRLLVFVGQSGYDLPDFIQADVILIGLGVNCQQNNALLGLKIINNTITTAFTALCVAIWKPHFIDSDTFRLDVIAGSFATF